MPVSVTLIVPTVRGVGEIAVIEGAGELLLELLPLEVLLPELLLEPPFELLLELAVPTVTVMALLKLLEEVPTWKVAVAACPW